MAPYAQNATHFFALVMACVHACIGALAVYRITTGRWVPVCMEAPLARRGLWIAAAFPSAAVLLALWYSEVVGIPVCALCWFARTMMFPLAFILVLAAVRNDRSIIPYGLLLSGVGAVITGYHHLLQVGFVKGSVCSLLKQGGGCEARYVWELGYITMPLFGFTIFIVTALTLWLIRKP